VDLPHLYLIWGIGIERLRSPVQAVSHDLLMALVTERVNP